MSGLQNFLAPFSHLLFANRNIAIVLLSVILGLVAVDALFHRWKTQRLHKDLAAAKSAGATGISGRRYQAAPPAVEEAPREAGGPLPPVKGGRTYARNLGSALQKAGMPGPQIYSPPTPPGWAPSNAGQPAQPGAPSYPAPNAPWAAPAPAAPTPWAFQGTPGRPGQGPTPSPVPFYQPQPSPPQAAPVPPPTAAPATPGPGLFTPPSPTPGGFTPAPSPFGPPPFAAPAAASAAPAPAPSFAPPGPPTPPVMPPFSGAPAPEPTAPDGGRRGKPKRRRFNFNVLENLEKMVQPKPAEPLPSAGWTPPAAGSPTVSSPAPGIQAGPPSTTPFVPPAAPIAEKAFPTASPTAEAPTLPLAFGPPAVTKTPPPVEPAFKPPVFGSATPVEEKEPEAAASIQEGASVSEQPAAPDADADADAEAESRRRSMRSMMFGEEIAAPEEPTQVGPTAEAPAPEAEPEPTPITDAEPSSSTDASVSEASTAAETPATETLEERGGSWPSYPWSRREQASSATEETPSEEPVTASEPSSDESHEAEPAVAPTASEGFDPWTPSYAGEPAVVDEPVTPAEPTPVAEVVEPQSSEAPEEPTSGEDGKSDAGTIVIIEDDPTAASYYATLFRGNGYQVEVANDGVSGVDLATRKQPQVILLDVMMPRQNGILVLQTLRASDETKNTPVVVMSNFSEPTLIKRALQLGALEYVIKTQVEGPALLNAVPRWMNREKAFAAA